jgi:hypothetical protein
MISTRLPFARAQVAHHPVGIERQSVGAADIVDALGEVAGLGRVLHAERDVLGHAQRLEQREMLEHHRHARGARGPRLGRGEGGPVQRHGPLSGRTSP